MTRAANGAGLPHYSAGPPGVQVGDHLPELPHSCKVLRGPLQGSSPPTRPPCVVGQPQGHPLGNSSWSGSLRSSLLLALGT